MFSSLHFFEKHYERYLRIDEKFDSRLAPISVIDELSSKPANQKNFIKTMTKKTSNGFKIMRRLTLAHMLLMYSKDSYDLIESFISVPLECADQWLNQQCIRTYYFFLRKVVSSKQMYNQAKETYPQNFSFETIFYLNNLMMELFKIVAKMPLLGRYFKDSNEIVVCSFVQTIAVQAQKLYLPFKSALQDLLNNHKKYLHSRQEQKLVKLIFEECLPSLNEEMKKLFLDKYFYPYGKGIGIRLFRTEEQNEYCLKVINGIISDHKETERRNAHEDLEKTLFPDNGLINLEFYEQSLMMEKSKQEVVEDLDEVEQKIVPTQFDLSIVTEKIQKQTSHHMEICDDV